MVCDSKTGPRSIYAGNQLNEIPGFVTALFQSFHDNNIEYCVLRGYEKLPVVNKGGDIDLLINRKQRSDAEAAILTVLKALGFQLFQKIDRQYVVSYDIFKDQFILRIDYWFDFEYLGALYFTSEHVLSYKRRHRDFYIPAQAHEALIVWLQNLLYGGKIKSSYTELINKAVSEDSELFYKELLRLFGKKLGEQIWQCLVSRDLNATLKLRGPIYSIVRNRNVVSDPIRYFKRRLNFYIKHMKIWLMPPGVMVVFLGPDGCGKTTVASRVFEIIGNLTHSDTSKIYHLRPGYFPPLARLMHPRKWGKPYPNITRVEDPHAAEPSGTWMSFMRLVYYLMDYTLGYYLKTRAELIRGGFLVFDRYYYDYIVDQTRMRIKLPKGLLRLFLPIIPRPSITIYLDAPPELLYKRKQELPLAELQRQTKEFRELIEKLPNAYIIDASKPLEQVTSEAIRLILEKTQSEWRPFTTSKEHA